MPTQIDTPSPNLPLRAERLRPALSARRLGRAGLGGDGAVRLLWLERGQARFTGQAGALPLTAPALGWFPWAEDDRIDLSAGAQGAQIVLGAASLEPALGPGGIASELRDLLTHAVLLDLDPGRAPTVPAAVEAILSETAQPGTLSPSLTAALLHVILVHLFRAQTLTAPDRQPGSKPGTGLATRFTRLVEARFRRHWRVAQYAAALGVSRDRLGDTCMRGYGRSPGELIRARLHLEARRYLDSSDLSVDHIAGLLGFPTAPRFNRFFKAREGIPPGRYRAERRAAPAEPTSAALYAWP